MANSLSPHYNLTTPTIGRPILNATALGIFEQPAPITNVPTVFVSVLITPNVCYAYGVSPSLKVYTLE